MNRRAISHDLFGFTALLVLLLFVTSCGTPLPLPFVARPTAEEGMQPRTETATPAPTSTPTPQPFVLRSGGVGLTYPTQRDQNQLLLMSPVSQVLFSVSWEALIASKDFKDLIAQQGCVNMVLVKPDQVVGPVSLGYSVPAVGGVITPTVWSDLSLFDRPAENLSGEPIPERQIIASQSFTIDQTIPVTPSVACGDNLIEDEIDNWRRWSGQNIRQADRILITAIQPDGSSRRILIIINPLSGASCEAAKTACSRCESCGYEWVCTVVSWVCN